jgi:polyketide biosynthesis 3-hydroxy-3-methylglutaryl-CoA synthase-like enzyme PksG
MTFGIADISPYVGVASLDVATLFAARGLDQARIANLMMTRKSVNLPVEDPVTNGVNAARPLIDRLGTDSVGRIEAVVVGTESGLDYGKPISTYIQHHLELPRRCRSFEVKHACYGGTAALRTAEGLLQNMPQGSLVLVVATDAASAAARNTYWEPSQGAGSVAMLVGFEAPVLALDRGAYGVFSREVMDTLRPRPNVEAGDTDLSLVSYLQALEETWQDYAARVTGADLQASFDRVILHTPFAGMVKGALRQLLTRRGALDLDAFEMFFTSRTEPSLAYCSEVGNAYSAALYLALCSMIDRSPPENVQRYALFSYGSGCSAEFYSGLVQPEARDVVGRNDVPVRIAARHPLTMDEYETVSDLAVQRMAGVANQSFDTGDYDHILASVPRDRPMLVLEGIRNYHRAYRWL